MFGQPGFLDLSGRYEALSAARDPLERLLGVVDFEASSFGAGKSCHALQILHYHSIMYGQTIPKSSKDQII